MRFNIQSSLCLAGSVLAASLCLLQPAAAEEKPVMGGTAVVAIGDDPSTVNPLLSTGAPEQLIGCLVYQGLTQVTPDLKVVPLLAKSWTISSDGKVYTFQLQQAKWHDGKPFTSEDVKHSLGEVSAKYSSIFASAARLIDGIDTPSPDRVVIRLKEPFGPLLLSLACFEGGAILPAHLFKDTDPLRNPASISKPVGTGAFRIDDWKRGDFIKLVKNKDYWEPGKPFLDEVIAKIVPKSSSMLQALQAGEVDLVPGYYLASNDYDLIRRDKRLQLHEAGFPASTSLMFMNVRRKPLDDVRVRQALFSATDRSYLLNNAWFGDGKPSVAPFNFAIGWAANPAIDYNKLYPFDIAKANRLLDAAGLKRGDDGMRFKIKVAYAANAADRGQVAQALKSMWRAAGVDVTIDAIERSTQLKRVHQDGDFDISIESYNTYGDPALGIARVFTTGSIGRVFGNLSGYSNPDVDALLQKGERATNLKDRAEPYKAVQTILARDVPSMSLRDSTVKDAATAKLNGALWSHMGRDWSNAWLSK